MSVDATRWAWQQQQLDSRTKLLLLSLSDRAGEEDTCWPSWKRLSSDTGLDRKTVHSCLVRLVEARLIYDTGLRVGKTKKVVVWRLVGVAHREEGNNPENGTVPFFPPNKPKNGTAKQFQKRYSEPTIGEPKKESTTTCCGSMDMDLSPEILALKGAPETLQHADLPPDKAQIVMDELASQIMGGVAKFPSRLLKHLIEKAKTGEIERTSWGRKIEEERAAARKAKAADDDYERRKKLGKAQEPPTVPPPTDPSGIMACVLSSASPDILAGLARIRRGAKA